MTEQRRVDSGLLRALRTRAGLRQSDVAFILGVSRSTVANMEAGRQAVSPQQAQALSRALPEWAASAIHAGGDLSPDIENASIAVEDLTITYVFEASRSPSEIIQVRRVRARREGVSQYSLGLTRSDAKTFSTETKMLWGGVLDVVENPASNQRVDIVDFGRGLRRGEVHEFAMRSWVEHDAEPDTEIWLAVTIPTRRAAIHLAFHGAIGARRAWSFVAHDPESPCVALPIGPDSAVTLLIDQPIPYQTYALAWEW
ncbi:helix-turn-helix domain-containing protein [Microbacterium sp. VKM Ac-2923]|uniref:helix-turn-helix domain-containing protein n=1 Tax=Microbacterium sp. VKM Ac-2923 TaxID=2929476 RepID=UPI001FB3B1DE|nr:helix-turn-helix transcriptional regulator [Microbacterium sp. VKM Ac-2923]MCJ1709205.1 helix-turn-helix transcriptional regulator [Microbacterium sp. VKM Ac-2923]